MTADLETARTALGIPTQAQFAALLGITERHYRKLIACPSATQSRASESVLRLARAYLDGYRPGDWPSTGR